MDNEQRQLFWDKLCDLPGTNALEEAKDLFATIAYPKHIVRYRSVSTQSINAMQNNQLFFSQPAYYDDPFDTFLHIDFEMIRRQLRNTADQKEPVLSFVEKLCQEWGVLTDKIREIIQMMSDAPTEKILDLFIDLMKNNIQPLVRYASRSICFTENELSEVMWMKYADQHRGFCLMFDLQNLQNMQCGKYDDCKTCDNYQNGFPLYPVYYSEKRYDATEYALQLLILASPAPVSEKFRATLLNSFKPLTWESTKVSLIKSKCHEYDQEWRILSCSRQLEPKPLSWIPSGVVLGLRMSASDASIVIDAAKNAGIRHIYQAYIDDTGKLSKQEILCMQGNASAT